MKVYNLIWLTDETSLFYLGVGNSINNGRSRHCQQFVLNFQFSCIYIAPSPNNSHLKAPGSLLLQCKPTS